MRRTLVCALFALCLILDSSSAAAQVDPASEIIQRVNALRAVYGVPAYRVDAALMSAAQAQASWCAANNHFGHDGPGGSSPDDRARAAGYGAGENSFAIENLAAGTASLHTPELVVTMWQGDWGHLNAMISADYEHIGVGYAEANDFSWYIMMVGWVGSKGGSGDAPVGGDPLGDSANAVPFVLSEPDESGAIYHEVQFGQTAWTIAAMYGIELAELLALNNLTEAAVLHPGDVLVIRPPDSPTSAPAAQRATDRSPGTLAVTPRLSQATELSIASSAQPGDADRVPASPIQGNLGATGWPYLYLLFLVIGLGLAFWIVGTLVSRSRDR